MFIATNRFSVTEGRESDFERVWRERDSGLAEVPGFRDFHLLRGATGKGSTLYVSHSTWDSRQAFEDWTRSDAFHKAHRNARTPDGTLQGHPQLEAFEVVL